MNKRTIILVAAAALAVAIAGCIKEQPIKPDLAGEIAVNLKADIKPATTTRVANDRWEIADRIGLIMKKTGQSLTDFGAIYSYASNVRMDVIGSEQTLFNPASPVMYPLSGNVDFIAYYPYTASIGSDYTVAVDLSNQASGLPVEVLYSNNITNQAPTTAPVQLDFRYSLAKIAITVAGGTNSELDAADFTAMTMGIEGMYTSARLNLADGTFVNRDATNVIEFYKTGSTATSATFEALVLPSKAGDGEITFLFDVGGNTYRYTQAVPDYASHNLYNFNFELDFPLLPDYEATLLNTVIIPRKDDNPTQDISINAAQTMTMTTNKGSVDIYLRGGTGTVAIDWGDGTPVEYVPLSLNTFFSRNYTYTGGGAHTITIIGKIMSLDCSSNQLTSLNVSNNTTLRTLYCRDNQLTSLNVSNNTALKLLECDVNELTSLDVSNNTALLELNCWRNQLTTLDVSKNTALIVLYCDENQLTTLDVSKNTALQWLKCSSNPLTGLHVNNNTALTQLWCFNNQLTTLDVSKNIALQWIECGDNQLTSLDVSNNTALTQLNCYSNLLTSLDVSKNTELTYLDCNNNQITSLDVSKNTALTTVNVCSNQLDADALDAMLGTLHSNAGAKTIRIGFNPGTATCTLSIATTKGWTVTQY